MSYQLDQARAAVERSRQRCREAFSCEGGTDPAFIWVRCWNYHHEVRVLSGALETLRLLEAKEGNHGPANDTDRAQERA